MKKLITAMNREQFEAAVYDGMLDSFEVEVFLDYKMNVTVAESAERLNCSTRKIDQTRREVRKKIAKHL